MNIIKYINGLLKGAILPSKNKNYNEYDDKEFYYFNDSDEYKEPRRKQLILIPFKGSKNGIEAKLYNDEELESRLFLQEAKQINFANKKVFIYFSGNNGTIQKGEVLKDKLKDPNNVIVQFNYPGVMGSKGKFNSSKDLIDSGIEVVKYLLKQGVKLDDIHLHGHS